MILYQKSGLLTEISRRDFSAAGLSGLSLPDAPCEHTTIRAPAANLTREVEKLKVPAADAEVGSSGDVAWARLPCHIGLRPLFGKWDGLCHCRAILVHGISKHAGELGRAKKLREKRIGNDVLSLRLLDMTVFHQLALGGIYSRRDSERMTSSICIAKLIRPFARQCDQQFLPEFATSLTD